MKINKPKFWDKNYLSIYSIFLIPISYIYQIIFFIRKLLTNKKKFPIPIVCVGNIYIGGTGKTPICIKLKDLIAHISRPVVIKKNYKNQNDEIELLKKYSKVIVAKTRSEGLDLAIKKKYNVAILDDGFQDYSIQKDFNIVCFNNKQQIGNGQTLPAGPLRENLSSLKKCDLALINGSKINSFEDKLKKYNSNIKILYFNYFLKNFEEFKNKKLIAFAGIGNNRNFFDILKENRLNTVKEISFPDHYNYSDEDLEKLIKMEDEFKAKLITTEKDFLRISPFKRKRFGYVPIKVNIDNEKEFVNYISEVLNEIN